MRSGAPALKVTAVMVGFAILALGVLACPGELQSEESFGWRGACPLDAFEEVVKPRCGGIGCHSPQLTDSSPPPGGSLVLTEDALGAQLVGAPVVSCEDKGLRALRIDPFAVEASYVLRVLTDSPPACSRPMPPTGKLTEVERRCVEDWARGALLGAAP